MNFIFLLLIFLTAFTPRILAAHRIDMTWDEGLYIACGAIALKNVMKRDFSSEAWSFEFHPPVMMYLYGMAYALYAFLTTLIRSKSIPHLSFLYQEGIRLFTGRKALLIMRLPSVILGSLSCVFVYLICLDVFKNQLIGIVAALFLALTPSFIAWSSLAMLESGVTFFYLLTIWTIIRAVELSSISYLIISGISLGLAFGSKETGFGILLAVLPWSAFMLLRTYMIGDLSVVIGECWLLLVWLLLGFAVFYATWPWLWKNPVRQFVGNLRAASKMRSRAGGYSFYLANLLASTPVLLIFLYGVGMVEATYLAITQASLILFLSWIILPLALMSLPFVPKRGGAYEVMFILPPLSMLAGLATYELSRGIVKILEGPIGYIVAFGSSFHNGLVFLALGVAFVGLMFLECVRVHPYYVNYYNFAVKCTGKAGRSFPIGWWGEGMGEAIAYIDQHAPPNTTIWIYGPKTTALYHSSRADLRKSAEGEPLFYERAKIGFDVPIDNLMYMWRRGDLKFYFPYYYPDRHKDFSIAQLKAENVSYILIYRWATYDPGVTIMDLGNFRIVSTLRNNHTPVFTAKIKDMEVCWIYKVQDLVRYGE